MATERLVDMASPPLNNPLHLLVFGSTLVVYNTPRLIRRPYGIIRTQQINRPWFYVFFYTGLALTGLALPGLSRQVMVAAGLLGLFAFAYFLPVLPFKNKKRLRDVGGLKITVLAGVWTTATSILPMIYHQKNSGDYPYEILLRFVFIFTLCIVFDIRDMQADMRNNIRTLPHRMGIENSYRLINITLGLFALLSIIQYFRYYLALRLAGALLTVVITWIVVTYLRKKPADRAYIILADGMMLMYSILVLLN